MQETPETVNETQKPATELDYYGKVMAIVSPEARAAIKKSGHGFYDTRGDARLTVIMLAEVLAELKLLNSGIALMNLRSGNVGGLNVKVPPVMAGVNLADKKS